MMQRGYNEMMVRICCAILCGTLIGWERQRHEKPAGVRTHVFVCLGAALAAIVSAFGFSDALKPATIVLDPSRVAAQVMSGIGFLGAGVIWFARNKVHGLTTAAGIWATAAVGLASGCGMYLAALTVTGVMVFMNLLIKPAEEQLFRRQLRDNSKGTAQGTNDSSSLS